MVFLLSQSIDKIADRHPDHEAVRCLDRSLTYAELVGRSNSLARALIDQGIKKNDRVGIYLNKSLESLIAIYGIMKAGAAYVPLDPAMPVERLRYVIEDCTLRHLITQEDKQEVLSALASKQTALECLIGISEQGDGSLRTVSWDDIYSFPGDTSPDRGIIEQDLAYIMYTSGSTGDPKGIMHTHHSGLSYGRWVADAYDLRREDRIANHTPLHFDISTFDFWGGTLVGSSIVLIPEMHTRLPASYSKLLADERISILFTVPFALIQLLQRGVLDSRDLSALRWAIYGGEPFPIKHLRALMQALPRTRFSNIYGPAEVNGVTFYHIPPIPEEDDTPVPIGQVCPFAEALVVDDQDQLCAVEETGELLIRSPTMMQGYWGRPDLNAKAFYHRPVVADHDDVFYRTGDLVQRREDGNYMFQGRKDRQIKTRGFRVELDEIEAALVAQAQVEEAAVFSVPDETGSTRIEAAVTLHDGASVSPAELTKYLKSRLAWYAIPSRISVLDGFSRTSSGKINRRFLQNQALSQMSNVAL